ncbi:hypothetical protein ACIBI9_29550 [Nonomuraea sp. NPDC050451]|uniref:hypothetical protein n=1 Tax=Nonomuraea sp. NPDC050451 TaxID=3364364 RepID=UPI00378AA27A
MAISTATAPAAIHRAGILHGDFEPGNILMGPEGPVVIDSGVARAPDAPDPTSAPVPKPTRTKKTASAPVSDDSGAGPTSGPSSGGPPETTAAPEPAQPSPTLRNPFTCIPSMC